MALVPLTLECCSCQGPSFRAEWITERDGDKAAPLYLMLMCISCGEKSYAQPDMTRVRWGDR